MERLRDVAIIDGIEIGTRTNEVVAYGKIGVTCRAFLKFIRNPAVVNVFSFDTELMIQEMFW